jgi:hypothetical protein
LNGLPAGQHDGVAADGGQRPGRREQQVGGMGDQAGEDVEEAELRKQLKKKNSV